MAQAKPTTEDGFDYIARGFLFEIGVALQPATVRIGNRKRVAIDFPGSDMGQEFVETANLARR
jgi:hypothetical protein